MFAKLKRFIRGIKSGVATRLDPAIRRIYIVKEVFNQIDSLYYIMNHCIDIRSFPKATGLLREVQLADAELLRVFHDICKKHQLAYWLDYGTLLGAVRHKGFIPWDDDLDVCMPREDYNKVLSILKDELTPYGLTVGERSSIYIGIWEAGINLDVFAVDSVQSASHSEEEVYRRCQNYVDFVKKNRGKRKTLDEKRVEIIGIPSKESPFFCHCLDTSNSYRNIHLFPNEVIFPLKQIVFEDKYYLNVPGDYDSYLRRLYGDYMSFPKSGMLHHQGVGIPLHQNAEKYGLDLKKITQKLASIVIK